MNDKDLNLEALLAKTPGQDEQTITTDEPMFKLVVFALGQAWYAFAGENIQEILPISKIFYVPGCPESLEGVINVRGDIESVIRLSRVLGLPEEEDAKRSTIMLGQGGGMRSGIRVNEVVEVMDVRQSTIQPAPSTLPDNLQDLVIGVLQHNEKTVTILDLEKLFENYRRGLE